MTINTVPHQFGIKHCRLFNGIHHTQGCISAHIWMSSDSNWVFLLTEGLVGWITVYTQACRSYLSHHPIPDIVNLLAMLAIGYQVQVIGELYVFGNFLQNIDAEAFAALLDVCPTSLCCVAAETQIRYTHTTLDDDDGLQWIQPDTFDSAEKCEGTDQFTQCTLNLYWVNLWGSVTT